MKLKEVSRIESGKNVNRLNKNKLANQYTSLDAENDFYLMGKETEQCSNIIAFDLYPKIGNSSARVISEENSSKIILNQKMCKIIVDGTIASAYYICYLLNEDESVKKQKNSFLQGSFIERLQPSILSNLEIQLPSLKEQRLMGKIYVKSIYNNYLKKKLSDMELVRSKAFLRKIKDKQ
ncbi:restriction endonuclease subunit S [Limosilactobacillus fastidiosus]|uniref:Restriction endonuclease subunit S n=1 Tax=Limosilactobacillus fastidiosus TaxID=2759855 RepID=A0A7W3U0F0_9LACO|nr:restriction endonuclease subunit S [Limosilactobacillus fastidiosus]MBB1062300.1 restriction endonuclease subunit S [Limosilactobacillus fastidiosus]MBB1086631.1 restriction endonuclease subunit S [Limosilactobacillus fastidiosus]MCD7083377.1 restriction endonuclease subunit S [Limosilactobacillus fastidiosus]MCD7085102.1 restriction endonuclease subunit S [Limosilactobacillus fastidiosus]MCD7115314.1 restriction endonuclease subunit S [Limosilactobacillus fastidiosus]